MHLLLTRASTRLLPDASAHHGPLPPLLVVLTFVTGLVDAVSCLGLGHIFVANMTGNVVFLGFALAGDPQSSAGSSVLALLAFTAGALTGRRLPRLLPRAVSPFPALICAHAALVTAACVASLAGWGPRTLITLLAMGMGMQNMVVRKLAVPDLTTTILTLTLTGLASERPGPAAGRRAVSITVMFLGALVGGFLQLRFGCAAALAPAALLLLSVALLAARPGCPVGSAPPMRGGPDHERRRADGPPPGVRWSDRAEEG
ncbi:DUF1275 domain-containing protein [Streptomyces sp. RM72]|nr:DUF1275 domain-containing protein [Streptomyces sp. RM72]